MFNRFPNEIKTKIYEFDGTGREMFDKTVHQIKTANMIQMINTIDRELYLTSVRWIRNAGFRQDLELTRSFWWERFLSTKLKKKN